MTIKVVLVGQPNVGKTMLINSISNSKLKVGNFSGVTIQKSEVMFSKNDSDFKLTDLPGTYSINDYSPDETVTKNYLENDDYDVILNVIDSTNLERNLNLTADLMQLNKKMIVVLNMNDEAEKERIEINENLLSEILGIPCIKVSAVTKKGLDDLVTKIPEINQSEFKQNKIKYSDLLESKLIEITDFLEENQLQFQNYNNDETAIKLIKNEINIFEKEYFDPKIDNLKTIIKNAHKELFLYYDTEEINEVIEEERHSFVKGATLETTNTKFDIKKSLTAKIDAILIHPIFGIPIFLFLMWCIFQMTFVLGEYPMNWLDSGIVFLGGKVSGLIKTEWLRSLLVDGIISGVGAVISFVPNIMILFLGISLLETTGYMARVAFLLDGLFHKFGLHGKSFIPLVTGFGCSIPAYMAARTLKNEKDRLITMFIIGFMNCSARLPIYVLFIGAFFAESIAGNVLFLIYLSGAIFGLIAAKFLRVFIFKGKDEAFVMEMPKYRLPSAKLIWFSIFGKTKMYVKKAGTFILVATVLIWFASTYPVDQELKNSYETKISKTQDETEISRLENQLKEKLLESSFLGIIGKSTEPIFKPIGFDWKMTIALETGLAAKEIVVATLGVLYSMGDEVDETSKGLIKSIQKNISLPSAVSFIVFVMVYLPCLAATIVFTKEIGQYKYLYYLVAFTLTSAWVLSFIAYRTTSLLV